MLALPSGRVHPSGLFPAASEVRRRSWGGPRRNPLTAGKGSGPAPLPSPMVRSGTGTYVLEKAGSTRCDGLWTENYRIWSENAPFCLLSERFGRGSVSNRSAAADAVRAFVVPFNSVSAVPARPAMGFRVLPAARPPRPSGGLSRSCRGCLRGGGLSGHRGS